MATEAEMDTAYEACALDYMQVSEEGMLEVTEDVAEAYEKMDRENPGITFAFCHAHARRYFAEALKSNTERAER